MDDEGVRRAVTSSGKLHKKKGCLVEMGGVGSYVRNADVAEGARYTPDGGDRGKRQEWNGSVSRFRVARLCVNPWVKNGHTLPVFHLPPSCLSTKSIRTSLQRGGTSLRVIGFRNDPLRGGSEGCFYAICLNICFTLLPTVCLANFPGIARSNSLPGFTLRFIRASAMATLPSVVSCCVGPRNIRVVCGMIQKRGLPGFLSAQQPESSRPLQLLVSRCLSVYPPTPMRSSLHLLSS